MRPPGRPVCVVHTVLVFGAAAPVLGATVLIAASVGAIFIFLQVELFCFFNDIQKRICHTFVGKIPGWV